MMEKATSWRTENTSSIIPAAAPSLPVAGAGLKAATIITTTVALMTMAAKNWNAVPVLSEVSMRLACFTAARREGGRSDRPKGERGWVQG